VLSIVALVVGLLSPLSFVAPLLWAVPIVGAAVSLAAIFRIDSSQGALIGRRAALVGLALCVASVSAAASRPMFAQQFISRQARRAALEWIALVQAGQSQQAFERTVASIQSPPTPLSDAQQPGDEREQRSSDEQEHNHEHAAGTRHTVLPGAGSPLEQFREKPVVHFLMTDGADMRARYERDLAFSLGPRDDARIEQQFAICSAEGSPSTPSASVEISLLRTRISALVPPRWFVADFQGADLPSQAAASAIR
jgi:hypothetical protein